MVSGRYHERCDGRKISNISAPDTGNDIGPHKPSLQNQIIACLICNLGAFSFGSAVGWSSPALGELTDENIISKEEAPWAGSLLPLGALISLPIFGYIARNKGRKHAAYAIGIPLAIGFSLKAWGGYSELLLVGRFLCGLGGGGALSLPPLYVGETCEPRARGFLSSMMMAEYSIGMLTAYLLGAILPDIHLLPVALLPIPLIFMLTFWVMPETPVYRLRLGQEEEAARSLAWLRKLPLNCQEVKEELTQMAARLGLRLPLPPPPPKPRRFIGRRRPKAHLMYLRSPSQIEWNKKTYAQEMVKLRARQTVKVVAKNGAEQPAPSWKQLIQSSAGIRGLGLCLALVTAQTFMGLFAVSIHAAFIFESAETVLSPNTCAILYAMVVVLGSTSSSLLMDKAGRRFLQITSCLVVCGSQIALAVSLQAVYNDYEAAWTKWLPLIALPICVFAFNIGAGGVPFVIVSEIFAPEVQDMATNIVMVYFWSTSFLLLQFFPTWVDDLGLHNVFYGFASVSLLAAIFSYYFLIETKGKSIEEILQQLSGAKKAELKIISETDCEKGEMLLKT